MSISKGVRWGLIAVTVVRLAAAATIPLSADEAYYWVWSKTLAPGYLDHPPMVALWIHLGTLAGGDTPLGVRLLGPTAALLGSLLLMRAAEDFWPGRQAAPAAACLLNATLALNAGAVVMTPDTPLLFFWTACLACLARLIRTGRAFWWLPFGFCAGLALDSKYTAALLGGSVALWVLAAPAARHWLRHWQLWAGAGLALLLFAPVLAWNAAHDYVSFAKQGGRNLDWQPMESTRWIAELLGGQIGLATPLVALVFAAGIAAAARGFRHLPQAAALACVTLLPAAVFAEHALGGRVQANWPAVIFPGAALAAAGLAPRFWRPAAALGAALSAAVMLQAALAPLALPRSLDFTLIRLGGWADLAGRVYAAEKAAGADLVATDEYGLAAELAFRLHGPVAAVDPRWRSFVLPPADLAGHTLLLVRSTRELAAPDPLLWPDAVKLGTLARGRGGAIAETYSIYRLTGRALPNAGKSVAVWLPQPQNPIISLAPN